MNIKTKATLLACALSTLQGCVAGQAVTKAGNLAMSSGSAASRAMMRAVGADNATEVQTSAQTGQGHWSDDWVWEGEAP